MKYIKLVFAITLILVLAGCEKALIQPDPANSTVENFDLLWKVMDEKYAYFTYKNIDWNALKSKYRPQATKAKSAQELFRVVSDMLYELKDGHVNLFSSFDISRNWEWYLDYPANFNYTLIERNYLSSKYQFTSSFVADTLKRGSKRIGYIYYDSFQRTISGSTIDDVLKRYKTLDGLIIDVRDNGGGSLGTADFFIRHFLKEKTLLGYTRYKSGPGHDDFTDYYPIHLEPTGETFTAKKVVVLTNRKVFSAANYFVSAMSQLPQVVVVGDQTGGGGGAPITAELQVGWRVRYSATQMFNIKKEHLEPGVPPGIKVNILPTDEAAGIDTILEKAISLF
jgi:hypothetical protein